MSKYIIDEEGRLYVVLNMSVYDIVDGKHRLIVHEDEIHSSSYEANMRRNFDRALEDAIINAYYQLIKGYDVGTNHYYEYEILDWDVDYRDTPKRREYYVYKTRTYKVHGKNRRYVVATRKGRFYRRYEYNTISRNTFDKRSRAAAIKNREYKSNRRKIEY